ncbi:MAG: ABC transporter ATP-binding protein/permease [Maricaulaceae bacterium]
MPPNSPSKHRSTFDPSVQKVDGLWVQLKSFGKLWPYLWPDDKPTHKVRIILALIITITSQFVLVLGPFFLGWAVNAVETAVDSGSLWQQAGLYITALILGYGGFRLLSTFLNEAREYIFAPVGQLAQRRVATSTFAHLHKLSLRFHLERRTGGLSRVIERGLRSIDFLFRFLLFNIGPTLLQLAIAGAAFAVVYDLRFTAIAIIIVTAYITFTIMTTEWRLKFRREMNKQDTIASSRSVDSLLNYETVKYFGTEGFETERYDTAMARYQTAAIRSRTSLATVNIGQSFLMNLGIVPMMLLAAREILDGQMKLGDMTAITLVMMQVYRPLNILGFAYREIKQALTDMDKMFDLLDLSPEIQDTDDAQTLTDVAGKIIFEDVDFSYEPDREILKGVSFTVEAGKTLAIVGPTGAGKSTVPRILYRFYDITNGHVRIDGQDISSLTQDSLRRAIGIVPQDTVLFNDTIGYNIGYAKPGASQSEIEKAAQDAQVHDFIQSLPLGYDTLVGERGLKLSGGEKQRVAIARTLLKNPAILILDEATSALDNKTERDIRDALKRASENRTTLIIAHRLSTITHADQIIILDKGEIVERGTHGELLAKKGLYKKLWAEQEKSVRHETA